MRGPKVKPLEHKSVSLNPHRSKYLRITGTLKVNYSGLIWLQGISMKSQSGVVYISQAITFGITTANLIDDS